jgi:signal transduction histidine kinase
MKTFSTVLAILFLIAVPLVASAQDATATQLVDNALAIWKDKGKDYALKVINASAGPLKKGTLYTFALDFSGTVLAHPAQTKLRGKNLWELKDPKGKLMVQEMVKDAKAPEATGWVEYEWVHPDGVGTGTKRTLVKRVPGEDILVACGYHVN